MTIVVLHTNGHASRRFKEDLQCGCHWQALQFVCLGIMDVVMIDEVETLRCNQCNHTLRIVIRETDSPLPLLSPQRQPQPNIQPHTVYVPVPKHATPKPRPALSLVHNNLPSPSNPTPERSS